MSNITNIFDAKPAGGEVEFHQPADDGRLDDRIDATINEATAWLAGRQRDDGHWAFELEADATIPAEYIMLNHYLDEIDDEVEGKLANYLRAIQEDHGGWPLYHDGDFDMSASVKAYFALKLTGDDIDAPIWSAPAKPFSVTAARRALTSLPGSPWRFSAMFPGGPSR